MKIIDNLLPESYVAEIEKAFTSPYFPWFSYGGTFAYTQHEREMYKNAVFDHRTIDSKQFSHAMFIDNKINSNYFELIKPIFWFLEMQEGIVCKDIIRIKSNFMMKDIEFPSDFYNPPHSDVTNDIGDKAKILLYYPCDSDGDTFIFNEYSVEGMLPDRLTEVQRVTPKRGRCVLLDANRFHASSPPRAHDFRIALNMVFYA